MSTDGSDWQGEGSEEFEEPITDRPRRRPYGARPYGARPYGARPYGARPMGRGPTGRAPTGRDRTALAVRGEAVRREWLRRIRAGGVGRRHLQALVLSRSAVVTLGATVVSSDEELWIPAATPTASFRKPGDAPPDPTTVEPY